MFLLNCNYSVKNLDTKIPLFVFWKTWLTKNVVFVQDLGRVVQKPVNANLGLKLTQGFCFSCYKAFALLIFGYSLKAVKVQF